jgi:hypothetical protein
MKREYNEASLEQYLIHRVKKLGGFTRKVSYQGRRGAPDRWCFLGGGLLILELKSTGMKPRPYQLAEMNLLTAAGMDVHWCDTKEKIDDALTAFLQKRGGTHAA